MNAAARLDARMWTGSFNGREMSLHQLAPYVGKMKSGMARALIDLYSKPSQIILDPFCGSGVVPLEAVISGRTALANDLSPYAFVLTKGKLEAPETYDLALRNALDVIDIVEKDSPHASVENVPDWVRAFYHPRTLREITVAFRELKVRNDYFLSACLLGILHHVRPGFLSFPASHLVPYLREKKYPRTEMPHLYAYRDLRSRLLAKVYRAYRSVPIRSNWGKSQVWMENSMQLPIENSIVDSIISSPPYFGALDYARDNRLRLWFLGYPDWKAVDSTLTARDSVYLPQMRDCIAEMLRILKPGGWCVLVLGDVAKNGKTRNTAEVIAQESEYVSNGQFEVIEIYDDIIPDERRSRRSTKTTKFDRILVMQKRI